MAKYDIANMYIANKMRDASDASLTARVAALETNVTTLETMSTTERVVGKWIDGRDIYEKVVDMGDLPTTATEPNNRKDVAHGIEGVDYFIAVNGFSYGPEGENNTGSVSLPFPPLPTSGGSTATIPITADNTYVRVFVGTVRNGYKAVAILRYVKVVAPSNNTKSTTKKGGKK